MNHHIGGSRDGHIDAPVDRGEAARAGPGHAPQHRDDGSIDGAGLGGTVDGERDLAVDRGAPEIARQSSPTRSAPWTLRPTCCCWTSACRVAAASTWPPACRIRAPPRCSARRSRSTPWTPSNCTPWITC